LTECRLFNSWQFRPWFTISVRWVIGIEESNTHPRIQPMKELQYQSVQLQRMLALQFVTISILIQMSVCEWYTSSKATRTQHFNRWRNNNLN
jgi:hypothetical protein